MHIKKRRYGTVVVILACYYVLSRSAALSDSVEQEGSRDQYQDVVISETKIEDRPRKRCWYRFFGKVLWQRGPPSLDIVGEPFDILLSALMFQEDAPHGSGNEPC